MSAANEPAVLGVDACPRGWVGIVLDASGRFSRAVTEATIGGLVAAAGAVTVVAVDMPIGLPDAGPRAADLQARRKIGPRGSSVFATPIRAAMECETYVDALVAQRAATGSGLSKQAWALRPKLLEVDRWLRDGAGVRVVEVHPEVSFATMNGGALTARKRTWTGLTTRRALLARAGIELPDDLGDAGDAGMDDVLDAAAAAWSARRVHLGTAACVPAEPETFSDGLPAAIWF